ncbi:hypothetical protein LIO03_000705 [Vibrio alginolyticus]|uniref:hypothetical protein n=1 Tax=Vibrio alginolyticus TaxID=663 RepID=UPI00215D20FD|nr:hypothetical protein [Vibrio alginolyticus]EIJ2375699.1 hypothetical protein [Vibrio alginolyticus]EIK0773727.1 hypothetical protein [Vibrio alginolyticus]EJU9539313.1 hypothetical protein [Vibrio alginolyticus]MCR9466624.1 hypothetical protein [Vibrio alginolyticus]MCR9482346.1 hypothetical protein [Vibrio alginolyticus]
MRLTQLTPSESAVFEQIQFLDNHFKTKFGLECFSQSIQQFINFFADKQGYTRRTIQNALRKLESLGLISIAYNQGFKGANLYYVNLEKLEELRKASLDASTKACDKVKAVFQKFLNIAVNAGKEPVENVEEGLAFNAEESYYHDLAINEMLAEDGIPMSFYGEDGYGEDSL